MSEYPIPEDLRELYKKAKTFNAGIAYAIGHLPEHVDQLDKLIERIAKQDAEILEWKDRLRQMTECRDDLNRLVASKDAEIERLKATESDKEQFFNEREAHLQNEIDKLRAENGNLKSDWKRLNRVFKSTSDKTISQDIEIEALKAENERLKRLDAQLNEIDAENHTLRLAALDKENWYEHQIAIVNGSNLELTTENERLTAEVERLRSLKDFDGTKARELAVLRNENERLKAPVSDEEWYRFKHHGTVGMRYEIDALLAARAKETQ